MSPAILSVGLLDVKKVDRTEEIHLPREKMLFRSHGANKHAFVPGDETDLSGPR